MNARILVRTPRIAIALFVASVLQASIAQIATAQGYIEINRTIVNASGGFPFDITQPGNYRLTGDLIKDAGAGNASVIVVSTSNVTVDLNSFSLIGPGTCIRNFSTGVVTCSGHIPGNGVLQTGSLSNITIRNGTIKGFFNGISTSGSDVLIEDISVSQNAFLGVSAIGDGSRLSRVNAQRNGTTGLSVQNHAVISDCNASENDDYGIAANQHSVVVRSFALGNRLGGMQLNPVSVFSLNNVLDNFGSDPVFSGQDAGDNNCTNAAGTGVGC